MLREGPEAWGSWVPVVGQSRAGSAHTLGEALGHLFLQAEG